MLTSKSKQGPSGQELRVKGCLDAGTMRVHFGAWYTVYMGARRELAKSTKHPREDSSVLSSTAQTQKPGNQSSRIWGALMQVSGFRDSVPKLRQRSEAPHKNLKALIYTYMYMSIYPYAFSLYTLMYWTEQDDQHHFVVYLRCLIL